MHPNISMMKYYHERWKFGVNDKTMLGLQLVLLTLHGRFTIGIEQDK